MKTQTAPISEAILIAVANLIDDSSAEPKRQPTHYDLDVLIERVGLVAVDPKKGLGQSVGKAKRVRAVLSWALDNDPVAGGTLISSIVAVTQGHGGFRSTSANFVGEDAIETAIAAFRSEGFDLTSDGALRPLVLDGLSGSAMTDALLAYVRRAQRGVADAALVTGTGKDLLEATAKHVLVEKRGSCPESTFPAVLGMAYVAVGLTTSQEPAQKGEAPQKALDRALFEAACAVNRIRNKEGTGHGRPWPPSITSDEARQATQLMGVVADRLLWALKNS